MTNQNTKTGIGGWLILVLIGLIVTPVRMGISLANDYVPLFNSMDMLDAYPTLQSLIYIEAIVNGLFGLGAIILLVLMLTHSHRFPKLMVAFYIANLVFVLGDAIAASQIEEIKQFMETGDSSKEIVRAIVGTAIWVPYLLTSTRVKETFVK